MAVSMRKQIAQNKRNTFLIMIAFIVFIALIGWLFSCHYFREGSEESCMTLATRNMLLAMLTTRLSRVS